MSLPDKCQFCGCDADTRSKSGAWVYYVCTSSVHDGRDARRNQSRLCEEKERERLRRELAAAQARIAELERELEQAKHDRNRIAHETRMEFLPKLEQQARRIGELEAEIAGMYSTSAQEMIDSAQSAALAAQLSALNLIDERNELLRQVTKLSLDRRQEPSAWRVGRALFATLSAANAYAGPGTIPQPLFE